MLYYSPTEVQRFRDAIKTMQLIKQNDLFPEQELSFTKWFGYRFMSPLAATRHFARVYKEKLKLYVRRYQDVETAEHVRGLAPDIFFKPSGDLTQLWKARQRADRVGLPYELLIEFGFEFASRRTWRHAPRPIQLFGSDKSKIAWLTELEKFLENRYSMALKSIELPQYQVEHYRGLAAQDSFRAALRDQIDEDHQWSNAIAKHCVEQRHLPILDSLRHLPPEFRRGVLYNVRRDRELGLIVPSPVVPLPDVAFVSACYGIPLNAYRNSTLCGQCPFAAACLQQSDAVKEKMLSSYGTLFPVQRKANEKRREAARRRKAQERARKKAMRNATKSEPDVGAHV